MRITGGIWRGRPLTTPAGGLRPTQDRVREALFSILGNDLTGRRFLDLFAGTGAVGFDALSRGAAEVWWVDSSAAARRAVETTRLRLGALAGRGVRDDAIGFLRRRRGGGPFDIIYADPPYARLDAPSRRWAAELAGEIWRCGRLAPGGLFVFECPARRRDTPMEADAPEGWQVVDERVYGRTRLVFYRIAGC